MPKSDEVFGVADRKVSMEEIFGVDPEASEDKGMGPLPPGMFDGMLSKESAGEPTAEEMEKAAEAVKFGKYVKVKDYHVKTFDLSNADEADLYRQEILRIYMAQAERRCLMQHLEKKLVTDRPPRMVVHMEWYEYELGIKDYTGAYEKKHSKVTGDGKPVSGRRRT